MEPLRAPEIQVETLWRTILVTDARNSSKAYFSTQADEALVRIERDRALFAGIAAEHGGEEARDRGDGSMFAFCDPMAALRAAMAMQTEIARLNAALPPETLHLIHRMGIHMGPIKLAMTRLPDETIRRKLSGDIVVTAARLEAIAHPGEVCFSNEVYKAVYGQIQHEFRYLDATLKGFDRPMRCWSTRLDRTWARPLTAEEEGSRQRRQEEKRLREKWEREQRERRMRVLGVRGAAGCAVACLAFAGFRVAQASDGFDHRVGQAWTALLGSASKPFSAKSDALSEEAATMPTKALPALSTGRFETPARPLRQASMHRFGSGEWHHGRHRKVGGLIRAAFVSGQFEDFPVRLASLGLPATEYEAVCDDVRRFERARDWLSARVDAASDGDESKGVVLEPSIAGMSLLLRAEDASLVGRSDADQPLTLAYLDLSPSEFSGLLQAVAADGDAAPDDPGECAQSLAALRRRSGRRP